MINVRCPIPHRLWNAACLSFTVFLAGCGGVSDQPELGQVEGNVTLGGKPLAGASVVFQPEKGRPSFGTTDENGHYQLSYKEDVPGAAVGRHAVAITTYQEGDPGADDPALQKSRKEEVPAQYNRKTTLTAEVKPGDNEPINFDLQTGGEILSPNEVDPDE